jgi:hypothetical protein
LVYVSDVSKITKTIPADEQTLMNTSADAGFMIQNVYLYCASQGLSVVVRAMIPKEELKKALHLKAEQLIILSQTIGYPQ